MVRKTIQEYCERCQDYCNRGERLGPTLNTAKTTGDGFTAKKQSEGVNG